MQVLARMIEVERTERTLLEAVFKDIPQPYAPIHHDVDEAGFAKAQPKGFVLNASTKVHGIRFCRNRNDMFREQRVAFRTDRGLVFKPVDNRRFNLVPVNPLLSLDARLPQSCRDAAPIRPS